MGIDRLASSARKERGSRAGLKFEIAEFPVVDHFFAEDLSDDDDNVPLVHIDF